MSSRRRRRHFRLKAPRGAYSAPGGGIIGDRTRRAPAPAAATLPAIAPTMAATSFMAVPSLSAAGTISDVLLRRADGSVGRPTLTLRIDPCTRAVIGSDVS